MKFEFYSVQFNNLDATLCNMCHKMWKAIKFLAVLCSFPVYTV